MGGPAGERSCKSICWAARVRRGLVAALLAATLSDAALAQVSSVPLAGPVRRDYSNFYRQTGAGTGTGDVIDVLGGGWTTHDSNVFRQPQAISDTTTAAYAGFQVNVPYSRQQLHLDVTRTAYRHDELSSLDFDGTDYHGAWLWSLTSRLNGSLTADQTEAQVPFVDFQRPQRNIRRTRNEAFNLDGLLGYGIHLLLGASHTEQISTEPFLAEQDFRIARVEGGLRYVFASGNSVSFVQRTGNGEYINRIFDPQIPLDTAYKDNETELRGSWLIGGHSTLSGRVSHLERRHEHLSQLDSSGNAGEVRYDWIPTGKVDLGLLASRTLVPFFDIQTTHRIDRTFSVIPRWHVTDRVTATLELAYTESDYQGGQTAPGGAVRSDTYNVWNVGVRWLPYRTVSVGALFQGLRRASSDPAFAFDTKIGTVSVALIF
jgi:exopolysaccharide biosynthesis operon protein EpsL